MHKSPQYFLHIFKSISIFIQAMEFKIDIQDDGHFELPIYFF